ncbi:hypothetical protein PVNG_02419 [Plasmodium vivax North Korean]|uniref:DNA-directed RNA polymerase n=1 Tax=Plasmodium vivax North Korean TaxID=1035514 RepID=A0A0J9TM89_PLAVI|nr:hypothetical protein PVNG_02419 [Plasmodium vivax North Korean]
MSRIVQSGEKYLKIDKYYEYFLKECQSKRIKELALKIFQYEKDFSSIVGCFMFDDAILEEELQELSRLKFSFPFIVFSRSTEYKSASLSLKFRSACLFRGLYRIGVLGITDQSLEKCYKNVNSHVTRIDFSKFSPGEVEPPNLRGIQIEAYNRFLEKGVEEVVSRYFPMVSTSGNTRVELEKIVVKDPELNEEESVNRAKTYQCALYLQVKLFSQFNQSKKLNSTSVFFGNMPLFSSSSNFIINGTEKFVISQIIRSPGLYALSKANIRLSNSRKRTYEGTICELLPSKGILLLFHIADEKTSQSSVKLIARNTSSSNAIAFPVSVFLKAYGISHEDILSLFKSCPEMIRTIEQENLNAKDIFKDPGFTAIMNEISNAKNIQKLIDLSRG